MNEIKELIVQHPEIAEPVLLLGAISILVVPLMYFYFIAPRRIAELEAKNLN